MWHRIGLVACLLLIPRTAGAQEPAERLLSGGTQIYLRWDGVEAHRTAYEQSALGKTLRGDTGKFFARLFDYGREQLVTHLKDELNPQQVDKIYKELMQFAGVLGKQGFILGVEVRKGEPVHAQATVIFPGAGAPPAPFLALLHNLAGLGNVELRKLQHDGRTIHHFDGEVVHALWWNDGNDAVLVFGTDKPGAVLKRVYGKGPRLTTHPLYQQLQAYKEFSTWGRGFIDTVALVKVARDYGPDIGQLVDDLGLPGLQSVTFHSGFDGPAERAVLELSMPGERKGLLRLFNRRPFTLADLPPLPADVATVFASNLDLNVTFDVLLQAIESGVRLAEPGAVGFIQGGLKQLEEITSVKIREDLFGSLDDRVIQYDCPSDAPLALGQVTLIKVKDANKLRKALADLTTSATNIPGLDLRVKDRNYHGVKLHEFHVAAPGMIYTPTYAIYKDWLVFSFYPQPVQGFLLAARSEVKTWHPDPGTRKTLDQLPAEFVSVTIADPRPRIRVILSLLPTAASILNSFVPQAHFDVGLIPSAHEVNRHLFPNVTVTTDDGKKVRVETRASLALPF
jgi:hypothetical protein